MGLAIVLAVGAALVIALGDVLLERHRTERSGVFDGPVDDPRPVVLGPPADGGRRRRSWPTLALGFAAWLLVVLAIVVPLVALVLTALTRAPGLDPVPANWTLEHFREVLGPRTLDALLNSSLLAGLAAIGVVILALLAVAARRGQRAGPIGGVLGLTFALPGSTLAVAVLLAYGVALRDTLLIILVAYLAKFWALGYRPVASGLEGMAVDLYRAARVSGADGPTTTRTIVLPLLRPLIVAGGLIVFVFGLHEVTMSSLLYGPGTSTLAVVVLNLQQLGEAGQTAALAIVLTGVVALASLPLLRWRGSLEGAGWRR
jgi:iron(III) transport system permease protein